MQEPERFRSKAYLDVLDATKAKRRCRICRDAVDAMRQHAVAGYPHEVCGLLVGGMVPAGWQVDEARSVANLNKERAGDRFQLDADAYRRIDRELRGSGREIIGVYHSHPDCPAKPSPTDLANAWEGLLYAIVGVAQGTSREVRFWALNGDGSRFQEVPVEVVA